MTGFTATSVVLVFRFVSRTVLDDYEGDVLRQNVVLTHSLQKQNPKTVVSARRRVPRSRVRDVLCKACRQGAQIRESTAQNTRSFLFSLGTPFLLLSTPSCCRKARFSRAKSRRSLRAALIKIPSHRSVSIMGRRVEGIG